MRNIIFSLLVLFISSQTASAHYFSESYSNWIINKHKISANFSILKLEATRILQIDSYQELGKEGNLSEGEVFLEYFKERIAVFSTGVKCKSDKQATLVNGKEEYLNIEISFLCSSSNQIKIINNVLFDIAQSHVHLSRIKMNDDILEKALFYNDQTIEVDDLIDTNDITFFSKVTKFIYSGVIHILSGFDHLIFLLGLLILIQNIRHIFIAITGFTIGHSITLALAALDIVVPNTFMIEALIGFTILFISTEYMLKEARSYIPILSILLLILFFVGLSTLFLEISISLISVIGLILLTIGYFGITSSLTNNANFRIIITSLFGLIHGFGFGAFLLNSDFDKSNAIAALFGFNLGVELGQIIFVLVFLIISGIAIRFLTANSYIYLMNTLMIMVSSLGFYWFIQRLYF
ncbi:MAG: HupE/UreJ family protein [Candidatus Pelagibacterales bacterium]|jgi:hypothetical protein|tara:strand:+ start:1179 stop:2402 length:1224 start_codon:yes stop_codon:yes gene_type:complete